jgi:hypothetical protein
MMFPMGTLTWPILKLISVVGHCSLSRGFPFAYSGIEAQRKIIAQYGIWLGVV